MEQQEEREATAASSKKNSSKPAAVALDDGEEASCATCGQTATAPGWMARHRNVCSGPPVVVAASETAEPAESESSEVLQVERASSNAAVSKVMRL
jgi:hypothetical protein